MTKSSAIASPPKKEIGSNRKEENKVELILQNTREAYDVFVEQWTAHDTTLVYNLWQINLFNEFHGIQHLATRNIRT